MCKLPNSLGIASCKNNVLCRRSMRSHMNFQQEVLPGTGESLSAGIVKCLCFSVWRNGRRKEARRKAGGVTFTGSALAKPKFVDYSLAITVRLREVNYLKTVPPGYSAWHSMLVMQSMASCFLSCVWEVKCSSGSLYLVFLVVYLVFIFLPWFTCVTLTWDQIFGWDFTSI